MAKTIEIKVFHVSERLPSVRVPVLVFTESGTKYIALRYETNPAANNPDANQIKWGLVYNNKIIGEVWSVSHWCPLNVGHLPAPQLSLAPRAEIGLSVA
jgi:hypothetical protein